MLGFPCMRSRPAVLHVAHLSMNLNTFWNSYGITSDVGHKYGVWCVSATWSFMTLITSKGHFGNIITVSTHNLQIYCLCHVLSQSRTITCNVRPCQLTLVFPSICWSSQHVICILINQQTVYNVTPCSVILARISAAVRLWFDCERCCSQL